MTEYLLLAAQSDVQYQKNKTQHILSASTRVSVPTQKNHFFNNIVSKTRFEIFFHLTKYVKLLNASVLNN